MSEPAQSSTAGEPYRAGAYLPAIDGLRALSIIAVLLYHDGELVRGGYLGVDVFFVLSGFLITSLLFQEWRRTARVDLRGFYLRRALRLFPALAALLAVALAFALLRPNAPQSPKILRGVGYSVLYLTNWIAAPDPMALGPLSHTWSLAVEEQFYLLWPLVFLGLLRLTKGRPRLSAAIFGLAALAAAWRAGLYLAGVSSWRLYVGTDSRADSLLVGGAIAVALAHGDLPRLVGGARASRVLGLVGAAVIGWFMIGTPLQWGGYYLGVFTVIALAAGALVIAVATNPTWAVTRFLSTAPLVWVGRLSYALYLWHFPIFGLLKTDRLGVSPTLITIARLPLAFVAAVLSYYLIERPFLRLKKRLGDREKDKLGGEPTGVSQASLSEPQRARSAQ
jgi:peptidoglycan/LPS O-acetylase OafA/YrhL